jgi:hypothetical protein
VVWHFYHVIFDPDVYPLNWACWNGKVSEHWHKDEHPLHVLSLTKVPSACQPVERLPRSLQADGQSAAAKEKSPSSR